MLRLSCSSCVRGGVGSGGGGCGGPSSSSVVVRSLHSNRQRQRCTRRRRRRILIDCPRAPPSPLLMPSSTTMSLSATAAAAAAAATSVTAAHASSFATAVARNNNIESISSTQLQEPCRSFKMKTIMPPPSATISSSSCYSTLAAACTPLYPTSNNNNNAPPPLSQPALSNEGQGQQQKRWKSVFVSKHNQSLNVTAAQILELCAARGAIRHSQDAAATRTTASHVILKECPFCPKPTNGKHDNLYKLYIAVGGGAYFCHRCGASGSWFDLKSKLGRERGGGLSSIPPPYTISDNPAAAIAEATTNAVHRNANGNFYEMGEGGGGRRDGRDDYRSSRRGAGVRSEGVHGGSSNKYSLHQQRRGRNMAAAAATTTTSSSSVVPCLPMPPTRLQAMYSSQLLDGPAAAAVAPSVSTTATTATSSSFSATSTNNNNNNNNVCLDYLVNVRGLKPSTLRKYGVGRARYKFRNRQGQFESSECCTFPWLMSVADIEYQEELRGAVFQWQQPAEVNNNNNSSTDGKRATTASNETISAGTATATANTDPSSDHASDDEKKKKDASAKTSNAAISDEKQTPIVDPNAWKKDCFLTRRIKVRSVENKAWQRMDPPGGGYGLFGYHTLPTCGQKEIIVTEGEFDAMAVWQATGRPAVSLPNGCRSLPVQVLPLLEDFEKIYVWMDNDAAGQEGAEQFVKKIGLSRCYVVRPTLANCVDAKTGDPVQQLPKDANEALLAGVDLDRILNDAKLTPHERILTFEEMRDDVLHEMLYPDKYVGTPIKSLPGLTSIIKGYRRGEMTVLTGPTGSGKTTFLGQLSLDLAEQGVNVLWGSFEIKNNRLVTKLLQQFAQEGPLPTIETHEPEMVKTYIEGVMDRFGELPLSFMKFHGSADVDDVLDAMDYAVYVNDAEHIILDNMQFMISRMDKSSTFDKFDVQDVAIEKFRKFATERNVHVTLVVHPRKEQEDAKLSMSSIYGSAKATQEADTVLILQKEGGGISNRPSRKYIEVKKNRFNGALGYAPLHFDTRTGRYSEVPADNAVNANNARAAKPAASKAKSPNGHWDKMFDY